MAYITGMWRLLGDLQKKMLMLSFSLSFLFIGLFSFSVGVDMSAHLGGFLAGMVMGMGYFAHQVPLLLTFLPHLSSPPLFRTFSSSPFFLTFLPRLSSAPFFFACPSFRVFRPPASAFSQPITTARVGLPSITTPSPSRSRLSHILAGVFFVSLPVHNIGWFQSDVSCYHALSGANVGSRADVGSGRRGTGGICTGRWSRSPRWA